MKFYFSILITTFIITFYTPNAIAQNPTDDLKKAQQTLNSQQAQFEENKGQVQDMDNFPATYVKYHYQQGGVHVFMLPTGIAYQMNKTHYPEGYTHDARHLKPEEREEQDVLREKIHLETYRMDMELVGANPNATIISEGKSKDYVNYYNKNTLDVHSFSKLTYQEIYPGIDWVIYTTEKGIKYDFVVQPHADPNQIKMKFKDHEGLKINPNGSFTLSNSMGSITEQAPISFQTEKEIKTAFILQKNTIQFQLEDYDASQTLIIDPSLIWATYYGGNNSDYGSFCTVDGSQNVYLSGFGYSSSNIASGGHQNSIGSSADAFIVKFNSAGTRLWASYYGGASFDRSYSCTVDNSGNVYLVGNTSSSSNIASGGHQNTYGGDVSCSFCYFGDAFIVKFNSAGTRLWASYYGGSSGDTGNSCTVDDSGNVYLAGTTESSSSIGSGGHQNTFGSSSDAFIVKFNSAGTRLWASYYGGTSAEYGQSCAVDGSGNVYLVGSAQSSSSIASGGHQNVYGGGTGNYFDGGDAFIVKFNSAGTRLWASYYGGSGNEVGYSCATDGDGNVYLTGSTGSSSNIALGGHQNTISSSSSSSVSDAFIVKFNTVGVRLWASYYGRSAGISCAVDGNENVYLAGTTSSSSSNIAFGGHQNIYGGAEDAFIAKFSSLGTRLWASYYGGSDYEHGHSCAVDGNGKIYLAGRTESLSNIALGGHQNTISGSIAAFLVKFCAPSIMIDTQTACNSYSWIDGNTYTSSNSTATYIIVGGAVNGCDSVVNLDLTINRSSSTMDIQTACNSYSWIDGNTYTSSNSSATHTIIGGAANGCDSIVTLNLTINNSSVGTDIQTACNSFTWIDGNTYTSNNNSATHTITGGNAVGCDSVVTLNLTINNSSVGTDIQTACNSYTWIDGNTYTSNNNSATHTITGGNAVGCDSIVTLNLTIKNSNGSTDTQTACNSYTWINGNTYTSSNNSATYTIAGGAANGCDSIVTLNLTINSSINTSFSITNCGSYQYNGNIYTSSGTYSNTINLASGCDSIVTLNLTIYPIDLTVSKNGNVLSSQASFANFQWIDCQNKQPVTGATSNTFTPSVSGNYAVIVTDVNCSDTSSCYYVEMTGISVLDASKSNIKIYPNPTKDNIQIKSEVGLRYLQLHNLQGQVLMNKELQNSIQADLDLGHLPVGMYILYLETENQEYYQQKIIKK